MEAPSRNAHLLRPHSAASCATMWRSRLVRPFLPAPSPTYSHQLFDEHVRSAGPRCCTCMSTAAIASLHPSIPRPRRRALRLRSLHTMALCRRRTQNGPGGGGGGHKRRTPSFVPPHAPARSSGRGWAYVAGCGCGAGCAKGGVRSAGCGMRMRVGRVWAVCGWPRWLVAFALPVWREWGAGRAHGMWGGPHVLRGVGCVDRVRATM
jgi:hypothetical protein